jgi:mRNA interferase MazF
MPDPKRGEVWLVRFDPSVGAEIQKVRPAVVVSVNSVGRLPLRILVPITDWQARYAPFVWMVPLPASRANGLARDSAADTFQVKSVSTDRFVQRLGFLSDEEMESIAAGVAMCVGYQ